MCEGQLTRLVAAVVNLAGDTGLEEVLLRLVDTARELVDAKYAALGVISLEGDSPGKVRPAFLSRFVHVGMEPAIVERIGDLPEGHGILGELIQHPEPLRLADLASHPASSGFPPGHPPMGTFLGAPVRVHGRVFGNIYLTEKAGGVEFTAADQELVEALAVVAGAAIANADLFQQVQRLSLIEDRERIGRDLHDVVIQRLFATGLSMQALARRLDGDADSVSRVEQAVDDLDETIREIRDVIFSLQVDDAPTGLRSRASGLCKELAGMLGFAPSLRVRGPVDLVTSSALTDQVLRLLREALTNVAKHAAASKVTVTLATMDSQLSVSVSDDGGGLRPDWDGQGLGMGNMRSRAADLGGSFEVTSDDTGTTLQWKVPV